MYALISSAEYPMEIDLNPPEPLSVMICELRNKIRA